MGKDAFKYAKSHEWIEPEGAVRKVGISDFAQSQMGDIVYVEFPAGPKEVQAGDEVCVIESCKATASVYAPIAGKVTIYNKSLADAPEKINQDPYAGGWLFQIEPAAGADASSLMDQTTYLKTCAEG